MLTRFKLVSKKFVNASPFTSRASKNGLALELISMYELAYCSWVIVVPTAATKGLTTSTRLGED